MLSDRGQPFPIPRQARHARTHAAGDPKEPPLLIFPSISGGGAPNRQRPYSQVGDAMGGAVVMWGGQEPPFFVKVSGR